MTNFFLTEFDASLQDDPRAGEGDPDLLHLHDQDPAEHARPQGGARLTQGSTEEGTEIGQKSDHNLAKKAPFFG